MPEESLSTILEREHHEIDAGIDAFLTKLAAGSVQPELLTTALRWAGCCPGRTGTAGPR